MNPLYIQSDFEITYSNQCFSSKICFNIHWLHALHIENWCFNLWISVSASLLFYFH